MSITISNFSLSLRFGRIVGNAVLGVPSAKRLDFVSTHQIIYKMNDLGGIEPPKSFRNAEDSVPYETSLSVR